MEVHIWPYAQYHFQGGQKILSFTDTCLQPISGGNVNGTIIINVECDFGWGGAASKSRGTRSAVVPTWSPSRGI